VSCATGRVRGGGGGREREGREEREGRGEGRTGKEGRRKVWMWEERMIKIID